MRLRVERIAEETLSIKRFELKGLQGEPLPTFGPGAHIDVTTPNGVVRQYSLYRQYDGGDTYAICVLKDIQSRGGSKSLHDDALTGMLLDISEPRNLFPLDDSARHSCLIAAGIGITPILCMADHLHRQGASFELHYVARTEAEMAFLTYLQTCPYQSRIHLYFSDQQPATPLNLDHCLNDLRQRHADAHLYACGPKGLMDEFLARARQQQWPQAQVHHESFGHRPSPLDGDSAFTVTIASTGQSVTVGREHSMIEALAEAGIVIPTSCEQGVCGTCLTGVLSGTCDHRDAFLMDDEREQHTQILPCVSRANSDRLVLDL